MKMATSTILELVFSAFSAIGALMAGIAAIIVIPKTIKSSMFNNETYYGDEAKERYDEMKATVSSDYADAIIPFEYGGGRLNTPKFELTKYIFDEKTMGQRRRNYKRVAKFYDDEGGKIMVKGWWLK
jgi:hypothetical protein